MTVAPSLDECSGPRPSAGSAPIGREIVHYLYDDVGPVIAGGFVMPAIFAALAVCAYDPAFVWAAIVLVVVVAMRVAGIAAFHTRGRLGDRRVDWRLAFAAGALLMGAAWGATGYLLLDHMRGPLGPALALVQSIVVTTAAARNAVDGRVAAGQLLLGLVPLSIAVAPTEPALAAALAFGIVAALFLVRTLSKRTIGFFRSQIVNGELVEALRDANERLAAANLRLADLATTDALTGLGNRRRFEEMLARCVRAARRDGSHLALLMIDIDRFKSYNDTYGHPAGDRCLQRIAAAVARCARRPGDGVARFGGEEFAVILSQTAPDAAAAIAETIRAEVAALDLPHPGGLAERVTVSIGVASYAGADLDASELLVARADAALYAAKAAGRDRICDAPPPRPALNTL